MPTPPSALSPSPYQAMWSLSSLKESAGRRLSAAQELASTAAAAAHDVISTAVVDGVGDNDGQASSHSSPQGENSCYRPPLKANSFAPPQYSSSLSIPPPPEDSCPPPPGDSFLPPPCDSFPPAPEDSLPPSPEDSSFPFPAPSTPKYRRPARSSRRVAAYVTVAGSSSPSSPAAQAQTTPPPTPPSQVLGPPRPPAQDFGAPAQNIGPPEQVSQNFEEAWPNFGEVEQNSGQVARGEDFGPPASTQNFGPPVPAHDFGPPASAQDFGPPPPAPVFAPAQSFDGGRVGADELEGDQECVVKSEIASDNDFGSPANASEEHGGDLRADAPSIGDAWEELGVSGELSGGRKSGIEGIAEGHFAPRPPRGLGSGDGRNRKFADDDDETSWGEPSPLRSAAGSPYAPRSPRDSLNGSDWRDDAGFGEIEAEPEATENEMEAARGVQSEVSRSYASVVAAGEDGASDEGDDFEMPAGLAPPPDFSSWGPPSPELPAVTADPFASISSKNDVPVGAGSKFLGATAVESSRFPPGDAVAGEAVAALGTDGLSTSDVALRGTEVGNESGVAVENEEAPSAFPVLQETYWGTPPRSPVAGEDPFAGIGDGNDSTVEVVSNEASALNNDAFYGNKFEVLETQEDTLAGSGVGQGESTITEVDRDVLREVPSPPDVTADPFQGVGNVKPPASGEVVGALPDTANGVQTVDIGGQEAETGEWSWGKSSSAAEVKEKSFAASAARKDFSSTPDGLDEAVWGKPAASPGVSDTQSSGLKVGPEKAQLDDSVWGQPTTSREVTEDPFAGIGVGELSAEHSAFSAASGEAFRGNQGENSSFEDGAARVGETVLFGGAPVDGGNGSLQASHSPHNDDSARVEVATVEHAPAFSSMDGMDWCEPPSAPLPVEDPFAAFHPRVDSCPREEEESDVSGTLPERSDDAFVVGSDDQTFIPTGSYYGAGESCAVAQHSVPYASGTAGESAAPYATDGIVEHENSWHASGHAGEDENGAGYSIPAGGDVASRDEPSDALTAMETFQASSDISPAKNEAVSDPFAVPKESTLLDVSAELEQRPAVDPNPISPFEQSCEPNIAAGVGTGSGETFSPRPNPPADSEEEFSPGNRWGHFEKSEAKALLSEVESLRSERDEARSQIAILKETVVSGSEQTQAWQDSCKRLGQERSELESQLSNVTQACKKQLTAAEEKSSSLFEQLSQDVRSRAQVEPEVGSRSEISFRQLEDLKVESVAMKDRLEAVLRERDSLLAEKSEWSSKDTVFWGKQRANSSKLVDVECRLSLVTSERDAATERADGLASRVKKVSIQLAGVLSERDALVEQRTEGASPALQAVESDRERAMKELSTAQKQFAGALAKIDKLSTQRKKYQCQRDDAGARLRAAGSEFQGLQDRLDEMTASNEEARIAVKNLTSEKAALQPEVAALTARLRNCDALSAEVNELRASLEKNGSNLVDAEEVAELKRRLAEAVSSAVFARSQNSVIELELSRLMSRCEQLESEALENSSRVTVLCSDRESVRQDFAVLSSKYDCAVCDAERDKATGEKILEESRRLVRRLDREVQSLRAESEEYRATLNYTAKALYDASVDPDILSALSSISESCSALPSSSSFELASSSGAGGSKSSFQGVDILASKLISALRELATESKQLVSTVAQLSSDSESVRRSLADVSSERDQLRSDLDSSVQNLGLSQEETASSHEHSNAISSERDQLRAHLEYANQSLTDLQQPTVSAIEYESLVSERDNARSQWNSAIEKFKALQEVTVSRDEFDAVRASLEVHREKIDAVWKLVATFGPEESSVGWLSLASETEEVFHSKALECVVDTVDYVVHEMHKSAEEAVSLSERLDQAYHELEAARKAVGDFDKRAALERDRATSEVQSQYEDAIASLKAELTTAQSEVTSARRNLAIAESEAEDLQELNGNLTSEFNSRTHELDEAEEKLAYFQDRVATLEEDLENSKASTQSWAEETAQARQLDVSRLAAEVEFQKSRVAELEDAAARSLEDTEQLQNAEREATLLVETHRQAEKNLEIAIEQIEAERDTELSRRTADLEEELKLAREGGAEVPELQEHIAAANGKIEALNAEVLEQRAALGRLADERLELKLELEEKLSRLNYPESGGELVDRRVVRQLLVSYFRADSLRRRDVLQLMSRMLAFTDQDLVTVGLKRKALMERLGSVVRAPEYTGSHPPPIGSVSEKWIEFLISASDETELSDDF